MPDAGPAINSRGGRTQAGGKPGAPGVRPQTAWRIDSTKPIGWDGINSTDLVLSFPPAGPTTTHETGAMKATTAIWSGPANRSPVSRPTGYLCEINFIDI
jgi:hypothetical protein